MNRHKRDHLLEEYKAVMALMRDTGESIWVINGAYLLAATVLLSAVAGGALEQHDGGLLLGGAGAGWLICILWFLSFQRTYAYYVLRIDYAKQLEKELGFWILRMGAVIGDDADTNGLTLDGTDSFQQRIRRFEDAKRQEGKAARHYPLGLDTISPTQSIQGLTSILILMFWLIFTALVFREALILGGHQ